MPLKPIDGASAAGLSRAVAVAAQPTAIGPYNAAAARPNVPRSTVRRAGSLTS
jgi:hypothetical protein